MSFNEMNTKGEEFIFESLPTQILSLYLTFNRKIERFILFRLISYSLEQLFKGFKILKYIIFFYENTA